METLNVQLRPATGKRNNRRLRREGTLPAVLYGHGQDNMNLIVSSQDLKTVVRHGSHLIDLRGAANESALIKAVQWDTYGVDILHVDLARVSADERIEVELPVELKGRAPGVGEGGIVEQVVRQVRIECRAGAIPEKLFVNVNNLHLEQAINASAIDLPEGATLLVDPDEMVVHCVPPMAEEELEAPLVGGVEPEVIGRKPEEGEEGEE
ncbi:MAG: 50S ribosomal protein L25 [Pirellulales bacterium]